MTASLLIILTLLLAGMTAFCLWPEKNPLPGSNPEIMLQQDYATIFEHSEIGLVKLSPEGEVLKASPAFNAMLGYPASELKEKTWKELCWPEDRSSQRQSWDKLVAGERQRESYRQRHQHRDGHALWTLVELHALRTKRGRLRALMAVVVEHQTQHEIEEALRHSENRYRQLFFHNKAVELLIDPEEGRIVEANRAAANYYGWSVEELRRKRITEINTLSREQVREEMKLAGEEQRHHFYFKHRLANGDIRDVEVHSGPVEIGDEKLLYSIVHDITERRRVEQALRESEQRFREMADATPVMIWMADQEQGFVYFNRNWLEFSGRSLEQEQGLGWLEGIHPEDYQRFRDVYQTATTSAKPFSVEYRQSRHDQAYRWILNTGVPLFHADGGLKGYIGSCLDITDRHENHAILQELNVELRQFKTTLDLSSDAILMADPALAKFFYANPSALKLYGRGKDDLKNLTLDEILVLPVDQNAGRILGTAAQGQTVLLEASIRRGDGELVPAEVKVQYIRVSRQRPRFVIVARDISERWQAQAVLRESAKLGQMIEQVLNLPVSLFRINREGWFTEVRGVGFAVIDHSYARLEGRDSQEVFSQLSHYLPHVLAGVPKRCRLTGEHPDRWVFDTFLVHDELEDGVLGIAVDISEQVAAEEALARARDQAESANRAKSAFLANMSHELRTPLNAMLGYAQILEHDSSLGTVQQNKIRIIRRSGEHLLTLINDVLDLAKIEAGRFELVPTPCHLHQVLEGVAEMFEFQAQQKGLEFYHNIKVENLPEVVNIDDRRLRQILINLLSNAVKFTEKGQIRLNAWFRERDLFLEISDTGIGMEPSRLTEIFEPFQHSADFSYKFQGSGLGLALTYNLVTLMEGQIQVESQPGEGSLFRVELPLDVLKGAPPRPASLRPENASGLSRTPGNASDWPPPDGNNPPELSRESLENLYEVASSGNIFGVKELLDTLATTQSRPSNTLLELRQMAGRFKLKLLRNRIRELLEEEIRRQA